MKKYTRKGVAIVLAMILIFFSFAQFAMAAETGDSPPKEVQDIIERLRAANGEIPDSVNREDMIRVIEEGGQEGSSVLQYLYENATPIALGTIEDDNISLADSFPEPERFSYQHNIETGETTYVDGADFYTAPASQQTIENTKKILDGTFGMPSLPRSISSPWYEPNPAAYDSTRSTCKLLIKIKGVAKPAEGTGFLIANNCVGTAGHCIFNNDKLRGWCEYITVIPSYNSNGTQRPYGEAMSDVVEVGGNWRNNTDYDDDWGVIRLRQSFSVGYLGLLRPGNNLAGWWVRAQGWPLETMYLCEAAVSTVRNSRSFLIDADIKEGMSGGPVIESKNYIVGIISARLGSGINAGKIHIVKFDDWLFNKMGSYR